MAKHEDRAWVDMLRPEQVAKSDHKRTPQANNNSFVRWGPRLCFVPPNSLVRYSRSVQYPGRRLSVSERQDLHARIPFAVSDRERKPPQNKFARVVLADRPTANALETRSRGQWRGPLRQQTPEQQAHSAPGTTPRQTSVRQALRDESLSAYRPLRMAAICWRASAQAPGFPLSQSNSWKRRAISFCHSPSACSSTVSSRLSRSEPAKAARAAGGRARAFLSNSEISSVR